MKTITIPTTPTRTASPPAHPHARPRRRAPASPKPISGAPAQSVDMILTQYQDVAAETFGDARKLAIALHDEGHPLRRLARDVALAVARMAGLAWQAAELESEAGA